MTFSTPFTKFIMATYLSPSISGLVFRILDRDEEHEADETLSARERQMLQLVAEGMSTKEAANHLSVSFKTADSHRTSILQKLKLHNTAALVRYAIRNGIVEA